MLDPAPTLEGSVSGAAGASTLAIPARQPLVVRPPSVEHEAHQEAQARSFSTRVLNVLVASMMLLLALPLMLMIAAAVKLSSPGPVFYAQDRVGLCKRRSSRRKRRDAFVKDRRTSDRRGNDRGGRVFRIYKFRTMRPATSESPQVWAQRDDPRVTAIGRFLRAHRLDELPQLWNVLKGDMNLVGPRPEQPAIFEELREAIHDYPHRQRVRPGITGWAQVNHRYDQDLSDVRTKLRYDLEYVRRQCVTKDLLIMAKTPQVMLFKQGSQ